MKKQLKKVVKALLQSEKTNHKVFKQIRQATKHQTRPHRPKTTKEVVKDLQKEMEFLTRWLSEIKPEELTRDQTRLSKWVGQLEGRMTRCEIQQDERKAAEKQEKFLVWLRGYLKDSIFKQSTYSEKAIAAFATNDNPFGVEVTLEMVREVQQLNNEKTS